MKKKKSVIKITTVVIIILCIMPLTGCGASEKKLTAFKKDITDKNYILALQNYEENKENNNFKTKADEFMITEINSIKENLSNDNLIYSKKFSEVASEILGTDKIEELSSKIEETEAIGLKKKKLDAIETYIKSEQYDSGSKLINELLLKYPNDDKLNEYKIICETNKNNHKVEEIKEVLNIDSNKEVLNIDSNKEESMTNKSNSINGSIPDNYSYVQYKNERYGYTIDYPSFLTEKLLPTNMDGINLSNRDESVKLTLSGSNNIFNTTVEKEFNEMLNKTNDVNYKYSNKSMFVISWTDKSNGYYYYESIGKGSINKFLIKWPISETEKISPICDKLYSSFKTPNLSDSW